MSGFDPNDLRVRLESGETTLSEEEAAFLLLKILDNPAVEYEEMVCCGGFNHDGTCCQNYIPMVMSTVVPESYTGGLRKAVLHLRAASVMQASEAEMFLKRIKRKKEAYSANQTVLDRWMSGHRRRFKRTCQLLLGKRPEEV